MPLGFSESNGNSNEIVPFRPLSALVVAPPDSGAAGDDDATTAAAAAVDRPVSFRFSPRKEIGNPPPSLATTWGTGTRPPRGNFRQISMWVPYPAIRLVCGSFAAYVALCRGFALHGAVTSKLRYLLFISFGRHVVGSLRVCLFLAARRCVQSSREWALEEGRRCM